MGTTHRETLSVVGGRHLVGRKSKGTLGFDEDGVGFLDPSKPLRAGGTRGPFKKPQKGGDSNQGATPYSKTPRPLMIWGSVRAFHEPGSRGGAHQDWGEDPEGTLKGPTKKRHQKEGEE